ncbi:ribosome maturation factor RimP [Desulfovibrio sp.]|uniref:ribosome maturation factor RimP n=1 Tax=Desulfovibrio sp. TaxID=885 RepID=UPI003AAB324D
MSENSLKETVTRLATPLVQAQGLEIWGVEIAQAGRTTVRVFVDLPLEVKQAQAALSADNLEDSADIMTARSASIDQCEEISRQLGLALEVEDLIEQAYVLEVSTPGFSRLFFSLDQMRSYVGDMVELRMVSAYAPENAPAARRAWRGVLREVTDSAVRVAPASVSAEGDICPEAMDEVLVPWDMVRRASRIHIFRQPQKPGKQPARKAAKAAPQGDAPKKGKGKSGKSKHPGRNEAEDI